MQIRPESTVGSVATEHPLATRVFSRHGIDFCCGGGRSLADACAQGGASLDTVLSELERELQTDDADIRWDQQPLKALISHLLEDFHKPLREELPRLLAMAQKVVRVHGDKDPERLNGVLDTLVALEAELMPHMEKEELILFPMIASGQGAMAGGPVSVMEAEHDVAGDLLRKMSQLTNAYTVPEAACNTWRALWVGLEAFENDLHQHIHLENNILFPGALNS